MASDAELLIAALRELRDEQRMRWKKANAALPGVLPKALGMIHARAAYDVEYAKRLVFDHFRFEYGRLSRDSSHKDIMEAVKLCLRSLQQDELDPIMPSTKDWKLLEKVAGL